jgi:hypothetical protein
LWADVHACDFRRYGEEFDHGAGETPDCVIRIDFGVAEVVPDYLGWGPMFPLQLPGQFFE